MWNDSTTTAPTWPLSQTTLGTAIKRPPIPDRAGIGISCVANGKTSRACRHPMQDSLAVKPLRLQVGMLRFDEVLEERLVLERVHDYPDPILTDGHTPE
jgi:hypothetical protein